MEWLQPAPWLEADLLGRLLLATVLGGAIGFEREHSGKPAGLRTNILICIGAALLTEVSIAFPTFTVTELVRPDPARLAAQIVSGIGFLGAGTIIQARGSIIGLTTAATIWVVAAIGIAVGTQAYVEAVGATLLVLFTLALLGRLEDSLMEHRVERALEVVLEGGVPAVDTTLEFLRDAGLGARCESAEKREGDRLVAVFRVQGPESLFQDARGRLLDRPEVRGFSLE